MRHATQTIRVRLNETLSKELSRAAAVCSSAGDGPISAEEYAAEIIESYMATRRLTISQFETFIDDSISIVDHALSAPDFLTAGSR